MKLCSSFQLVDAKWQPRTSIGQTILFSLPSNSRSLTLLNVAINTVVLLLAADFVLYPVLDNAKDVVFTRVGAVYPDSAKLVVRYPIANATENQLHILWRQVTSAPDSPWVVGPTVHLTAAHDWVDTVRLDGLWPSTSYECKFLVHILLSIHGSSCMFCRYIGCRRTCAT